MTAKMSSRTPVTRNGLLTQYTPSTNRPEGLALALSTHAAHIDRPQKWNFICRVGGHDVVTTEGGNRICLACSGPTRRRDINLIRQVGGTRSSDAVNSITDDSSLNPEVIAASA
jgi:hypothetical protein